jgi:chemotaxis protein MotB
MTRRKQAGLSGNHDRWLVSYADFITLLFAFFVVMFATSQADRGKAQQVSESVKKALAGSELPAAVITLLGGSISDKGKGNAQMKGPGGVIRADKNPTPVPAHVAELLPSLQILSKELEEEIRKGKLEISMQPRGLTVSFRQAALFPPGADEIADDAYSSVEKIANAIKRIPNPVRLEGHTDSMPIHNTRFRSNWELSAARSIALLELLTEHFDVPRDRISIAGYADTAPVATNETDDGRSRNRRVDIIILNATGLKGEPQRYALPAAPASSNP